MADLREAIERLLALIGEADTSVISKVVNDPALFCLEDEEHQALLSLNAFSNELPKLASLLRLLLLSRGPRDHTMVWEDDDGYCTSDCAKCRYEAVYAEAESALGGGGDRG